MSLSIKYLFIASKNWNIPRQKVVLPDPGGPTTSYQRLKQSISLSFLIPVRTALFKVIIRLKPKLSPSPVIRPGFRAGKRETRACWVIGWSLIYRVPFSTGLHQSTSSHTSPSPAPAPLWTSLFSFVPNNPSNFFFPILSLQPCYLPRPPSRSPVPILDRCQFCH